MTIEESCGKSLAKKLLAKKKAVSEAVSDEESYREAAKKNEEHREKREAAQAHLKDLLRHKRLGIEHPALGRKVKGSDIAHAQMEVGNHTWVPVAGLRVREEVEPIAELSFNTLKRFRDAGSKTETGDRLALNKMRKANGSKLFLDPKQGGYLTDKGPKVAATNPPKPPKKSSGRTSIYDEFEPLEELSRGLLTRFVKKNVDAREREESKVRYAKGPSGYSPGADTTAIYSTPKLKRMGMRGNLALNKIHPHFKSVKNKDGTPGKNSVRVAATEETMVENVYKKMAADNRARIKAEKEANAAEYKKHVANRKAAVEHHIVNIVQGEVAGHYPDTDGFDEIHRRMRRELGHRGSEYDTHEKISKVIRKHLGAKNFGDYVDKFHRQADRDGMNPNSYARR